MRFLPLTAVKSYFYPRSPCGERHIIIPYKQKTRIISIHALLAESDARIPVNIMLLSDFYPRSPCGERRITIITICTAWRFLSTLSLRRATRNSQNINRGHTISIHALLAESDGLPACSVPGSGNFYPRSPCGERRGSRASRHHPRHFYPRSPCGERRKRTVDINIMTRFLSTLSLRRATRQVCCTLPEQCDFYPRSPCGERPGRQPVLVQIVEFLSTLSLRRATYRRNYLTAND